MAITQNSPARKQLFDKSYAHHDEVAAQHEDGARVVGGAAVVGGAEEGDQVALGEALEAVHDALVRAHDHLQVVVLRRGTGESQT